MELLNEYFLLFMIYAFLGWLCESIYVSISQRKVINSGFMSGPICPIYGFGALFVIILLTPLQASPWLVFVFGVIVTSTLEYFTSWAMEVLFHTRWWDYSHFKLNLNGRICLLNSILFGLMSLFVLYIVHPPILEAVQLLPTQFMRISMLCLSLAFIIDFTASLSELQAFNRDILKFEDAVKDIRLKLAEYAPDLKPFNQRAQFEQFMTHKDERLNELKQSLAMRYEKISNNREDIHSHLKNAFPSLRVSEKKTSLRELSNYLKEFLNH